MEEKAHLLDAAAKQASADAAKKSKQFAQVAGGADQAIVAKAVQGTEQASVDKTVQTALDDFSGVATRGAMMLLGDDAFAARRLARSARA